LSGDAAARPETSTMPLRLLLKGGNSSMLELAIIALLIAVIAGGLGFTGVAAGAAAIAKIIFGVFLVLALLFFILLFAGISIFA
jgi:uncharacterized membrane protein YtjA (UPF0391 family)